jgi:hypothetical protein
MIRPHYADASIRLQIGTMGQCPHGQFHREICPCKECVAENEMHLFKLLNVIESVYGQRGDDNCWMDIDLIFKAVGLPTPDRKVGDKEKMKANCVRYIDTMCAGGRWLSYTELEARLEASINIIEKLLQLSYQPTESLDPENLSMEPIQATARTLLNDLKAKDPEVSYSGTQVTDPMTNPIE